ncbi:MAG: Rieske (2Fe-2S) protein [Kofleriaceae bacterium]
MWHPVAKFADIRAGDVIAVQIGDVEIALGRDGDRLFAVQRRCLHQGGDLANGIVARGHVVCPHHGWRFSTTTGCHDTASDVCLIRYAVRVTGDQIEIDPTPLRGSP